LISGAIATTNAFSIFFFMSSPRTLLYTGFESLRSSMEKLPSLMNLSRPANSASYDTELFFTSAAALDLTRVFKQ
jgi:hypothetical protein